MSPEAVAARATWDAILSDMESDLKRLSDEGADTETARRLVAGRQWQAPRDAGTIPAELVERAQRLLHAQREAVEHLQRALAGTGRHLSALRSIPDAVPSGVSVFLDVTG